MSTLHVEGCTLKKVLQEGLGGSAKNYGFGGDPRLRSGGHLLLICYCYKQPIMRIEDRLFDRECLGYSVLDTVIY